MKDRKDSLCVVASDGDSAEAMIKRFQKAFRNSGLMQELMDRRAYQKPSVKRRRKAARAMIRNRSGRENSRSG